MIAIEQLRYVRLHTRDLAAAAHFAQRILGLELVEQDDAQAAFRSDFRDHTLVFTSDGDPIRPADTDNSRDTRPLTVAFRNDRWVHAP